MYDIYTILNLDAQVLYCCVQLIVVNIHVDQLLWMKCICFNFLSCIIMIRTDEFFSALYSPFFMQFMKHLFTALFKNTQILKFNSKLRCCQIILADLSGNRSVLQRVQKAMVQFWFVIGRFRSFLCVSRFDVYNRNYNWRQQKTQLWTQLLNCRERVWKAE